MDADPAGRTAPRGTEPGKAMFTDVALHHGSMSPTSSITPPARTIRRPPQGHLHGSEVGAVGLTEAEAQEAGIDVTIAVKQAPATFRGWLHRDGNTGLIELVLDSATKTVVGTTVVGPHGGEVSGMLTLAVHVRIPLSGRRRMIYAFTTFHGGVGEAPGAYGRGVGTVLDPEYGALPVLDAIA